MSANIFWIIVWIVVTLYLVMVSFALGAIVMRWLLLSDESAAAARELEARRHSLDRGPRR